MKALRLNKFGFEGLQLTDVDPPRPADGQALLQVKAAGLNPSDLGNILGRFKQTTLPHTPGRDYAGVVSEGPSKWIGA